MSPGDVVLILLALILLPFAIFAVVKVAIAVGLVASIPFLFVWEAVIQPQVRKYRNWRDERRAKNLGLRDAYDYRMAVRRARQERITVEQYAERTRERRERLPK